jgi:hypothetical protein
MQERLDKVQEGLLYLHHKQETTKGKKMSGYYPEGVTGNEYQIAGGSQFDGVRAESCYNEECKMFEVEDVEAEVEIEYYNDTEWYEWKCPTCGETRDIENVQ